METSVLYMAKPVGGRGKSAPKPTIMRRIPEGIKEAVEQLADLYREEQWDGNIENLISGNESIEPKPVKQELEQIKPDINLNPTEWNCYAVHPKTGEQWFVMGEMRSEKQLKDAAHESFSRWDVDPYPGCKIEYRCEPVGSSYKVRFEQSQRNHRECLERNAAMSHEVLELKQLRSDRDELDREVDRLTEKVGDLDLEKQHLAEELAQARAELDELRSHGTGSLIDELPEASELLNQLKGKFPKSKVSLREVESLLELIDGGGYEIP